jgi:hypothetical protein
MPVDVTGDVDVSDLVDSQAIDAADVLTPIEDLIGLINAIWNNPVVGEGFIWGLEVEPTGDANVRVLPGACIDDTGVELMTLAALQDITVSDGVTNADTWYAVWIGKGSTGTQAEIDTSFTAPTLDSGYDDYKRLIGAFRMDASNDAYLQHCPRGQGARRSVFWLLDVITGADHGIYTGAENITTIGTWTTADLSAVVPPDPLGVGAHVTAYSLGGDGTSALYWSDDSTQRRYYLMPIASGVPQSVDLEIRVDVDDQTVQFGSTSSVDENFGLSVRGYVMNLMP